MFGIQTQEVLECMQCKYHRASTLVFVLTQLEAEKYDSLAVFKIKDNILFFIQI